MDIPNSGNVACAECQRFQPGYKHSSRSPPEISRSNGILRSPISQTRGNITDIQLVGPSTRVTLHALPVRSGPPLRGACVRGPSTLRVLVGGWRRAGTTSDNGGRANFRHVSAGAADREDTEEAMSSELRRETGGRQAGDMQRQAGDKWRGRGE